MTDLLSALDVPAPPGLEDLGGAWDGAVGSALAAILREPPGRLRIVADGLTSERAWALLSWAEGTCSLAVRRRSPHMLHHVVGGLWLLDGALDRRQLLVVAALARRAAHLLDVDFERLVRDALPSADSTSWLTSASSDVPPSHVEVGAGEDFEFRRRSNTSGAVSLEQQLLAELEERGER